MFIGEAGATKTPGRALCRARGTALTKMIGAMGKERKDVYIANVVKCRPPGNRFPEKDEAATCIPFLHAQIRAINPRVICTLGNAATQYLLETKTGITKLRGQFQDYRGTRVLPTYHPAFLLRSPQYKKPAWEDLQKIMAYLGWKA
ncbi:MAG: uracil-DNA glycosylase [Deltaproteobacteria bacterium]|nr:uracil-DNA glycosylase [Deltaproteobacteria bacterium]